MTAKVVELIVTESGRGIGTAADPCRVVTQYWTFDGALVFEIDQCPTGSFPEDSVRGRDVNFLGQ